MNINTSEALFKEDTSIDEDISSNALKNILSINIDDKNFVILRKSDSKTEGERLGVKIRNSIPILFLK